MLDLALKNTRTTLLDLDWFYDVLDLDLRNTRTTSMDLDWFIKHWVVNQAGMPLQKYEDFLYTYFFYKKPVYKKLEAGAP